MYVRSTPTTEGYKKKLEMTLHGNGNFYGSRNHSHFKTGCGNGFSFRSILSDAFLYRSTIWRRRLFGFMNQTKKRKERKKGSIFIC